MSKRPRLYVIDGGLTEDEQRGFCRLPQSAVRKVSAQEPWPRNGEWRNLIRRLIKKPLKRQDG